MVTNNASNEPTGASGTVLQGQGVGTHSAYSTATYPSSSGGAGKILYDNGTNFVESTPTFPASASATSRKIIVSDGTNWTASTETWATPGTSGNVLTSDGTNWTSAAPAGGGGLTTVTGSLTNSQIKNLHATPVQIVAAQGSGKEIQVVSASAKMVYGGTNVFTAGVGQTINLTLGTSNVLGTVVLTNASIVASSSQIGFTNGLAASSSTAATTSDNVALNAYQPNATEISGNAANDNTINYSVTYRVVSL